MTPNELDNGSPAATSATPNADSSAGQNASGGSFDAAKLQTTIESLTKRLDEIDARSRSLQGEKDRGVAKTGKEVEELKRRFAEIEKLTKSGLDLDAAVEEHDFRETVRQIKNQLGQPNPVSAQPVGNGTSGTVDVVGIFGEILGKDNLKNPALAPLFAKQYASKEEAQIEAYRAYYQMSTQPNPLFAQQPALNGSAPASNVDKILAELQPLQRNPTDANEKRRQELVAELAKVGHS